jgi:hypothetical protein
VKAVLPQRRATAIAVLVAFAAVLGARQAAAQATQPAPPIDSVPEKIAPSDAPTTQSKTLSDQLDQSNGVIRPKEVDPAIEKPAPGTGSGGVIKPPGTPGGAPAPQPK